MSGKKRPDKISVEEFRRQFADGDDPDSLNYNPDSDSDAYLDHDAYFGLDLAVHDPRWKPRSQEQPNLFISYRIGEGVAKDANGDVVGTVRGEHVVMNLDLDSVEPSNVNRVIGSSVADDDPETHPAEAKHIPAEPHGFHGGGEVVDIQPQRALIKPPGSGLMRLIQWLPGKNHLRKDLEQAVGDMREEHFDALAAGDKRGAQVALWRGRYEVVRAIVPSWAAGILGAVARWLVGRLVP